MKISELLNGFALVTESQDRSITGLCSDSRNVKEGEIFFALKGEHTDGRKYISEAVSRGAAAVIYDENNQGDNQSLPSHIPLISVADLSFKLGNIASRYYQSPSDQMAMIGVTGTNGKTSTSQYIASALKMSGNLCGVIGTLGYGFPENLSSSNHTTPDALTLQGQLADLYHQGANTVAMEVSSHALAQHRTNGVSFDYAIFTNLTRDHLDYHGTMENYGAAKKKLFQGENLRYGIINTDDSFGRSLAEEFESDLPIYCYGLEDNSLSLPMVRAHHVHLNNKGITAKVSTPWGEGQLRSRLLGRFNVNNLLAVLTTLLLLDISLEKALEYLSALSTASGRMQVFGGGKLPLVVVDYAHTPDALMQVLMALREHTHGTLWCVFGCGGDRDHGKRPLMGQIAERFSDQLLITDDNPRTEDPVKIVNEIVSGLLCPWAVEIDHDRGAAIAHVISCAHAGDVVLVAGKGHECYQIIGTEKYPFSDSEHVQKQLRLKQNYENAIK